MMEPEQMNGQARSSSTAALVQIHGFKTPVIHCAVDRQSLACQIVNSATTMPDANGSPHVTNAGSFCLQFRQGAKWSKFAAIEGPALLHLCSFAPSPIPYAVACLCNTCVTHLLLNPPPQQLDILPLHHMFTRMGGRKGLQCCSTQSSVHANAAGARS